MDRLQLLNDIKLPFAEVLGLKFTEASETGVKAEMVVRPELCTRPAILHGGAVMAFADTLGAAATVLNLPEGKGTTTIESKTNFLGAAPVGSTVKGRSLPLPLLCTTSFGAPLQLEEGEEKTLFLARTRDALLALAPEHS